MKRLRKIMTAILATAAAVMLASGTAAVSGDNLQTVMAAGRPVAIDSCLISGGNVVCQIRTGSVPSSDDGKFYIYADEVYQDGTTGAIVATIEAGTSVTASFPLNYNTSESNLSRKFLIAVKQGGQMVQVSDEHYITNPEAIASVSYTHLTLPTKALV